MMEALVQLLVPISVTVVMPVLIVWIVFRAQSNKDNKNAEIVIKAIENNQVPETDKIIEALGKKQKTPKELLQLRLLRGCIFTFLGIAALLIAAIQAAIGGINSDNIMLMQFLAALSLPIGIAYLVVYFVSRKSVKEEKDEQ